MGWKYWTTLSFSDPKMLNWYSGRGAHVSSLPLESVSLPMLCPVIEGHAQCSGAQLGDQRGRPSKQLSWETRGVYGYTLV